MRGRAWRGLAGVVTGTAAFLLGAFSVTGVAVAAAAPAGAPVVAQAGSGTPSGAGAGAAPGSPFKLASWVVWLDLEGTRLAVEQDVELVNPGTTVYAGAGSAAGLPAGRHPVLRLPLAPGAQNLQYAGLFEQCCAVIDGEVVVLSQPLSPGTSQGTVRYDVASITDLSFDVKVPTESFSVLVPPALRIHSAQLLPSGTSSDRGVTYQVYRSSALTVGTAVRLTVTAAPATSSRSWRWWTGGGVALVVVAGLVPAVRRRRPRPVQPRPAVRKRRRPDDVKLLVEEIALLDLAYEGGLVTDERVYHRVRAAVMERLVEAQDGLASGPSRSGRR